MKKVVVVILSTLVVLALAFPILTIETTATETPAVNATVMITGARGMEKAAIEEAFARLGFQLIDPRYSQTPPNYIIEIVGIRVTSKDSMMGGRGRDLYVRAEILTVEVKMKAIKLPEGEIRGFATGTGRAIALKDVRVRDHRRYYGKQQRVDALYKATLLAAEDAVKSIRWY